MRPPFQSGQSGWQAAGTRNAVLVALGGEGLECFPEPGGLEDAVRSMARDDALRDHYGFLVVRVRPEFMATLRWPEKAPAGGGQDAL